jgi:dTDP-4-amino-4,6-dideoxygalactose transaminase
VVRAGLKIYPVDVNPETLDLDPSQLEALPQEQLLCILTSNLFGFVNEASHLREAARAKGAFLVDDAAQALGSTRNGQQAGMLGDVGFFSFGRGKALATVEGAVIVTNSTEIASTIQSLEEKLPASSAGHSAWLVSQMLVYAVFLHPRLYWIPDALPFLGLGTTEFAPDYPAFRLPRVVLGLLPQLMDRLQEMNRIRRENAAVLADALHESPQFTIPRPGPDCQPNYVRFPLIARDEATRDRAVGLLRAAGIGASPFYPSAICDIEGIGPHMAIGNFHRPKAEDLSRRLLTLPTHHYVTRDDVRTIGRTLLKVAAG